MKRFAHAIAVTLLLGVAGQATARHSVHAAPPQHPPHDATPPPAADPRTATTCSPEHAAMGHCTPTRVDPPASPACSPDHAAMGHCTPPATPTPPAPCSPGHAAMGHCTPAPAPAGCTPEHAAMGHCAPAAAMPREPVPPVTGADRAAAFPVLAHAGMVHAPARYTRVTLHRLEGWEDDGQHGAAWDASASTGGDIHRLWLRGGGERAGGRTTASHVELQASRAVARWWDVFAGMRHDIRPGEPRTRSALGVRGLAPYMFEVSATAYLGAGGLSAELEAEYDLRFTNRLVLQPSLELELDARDDQARGTGRGLSTAEAGLRLRYEVTRRFAPYVGVVHERAFGATARARETVGGHARETRVVAGVRIWF